MIKLLIVDDEADICLFAKSFFERRNYIVFTAHSGAEALTIFGKENPDIVLIDVMMADMNGVELLKAIKKQNKEVVAIMVSGIDDMDTIEEARLNGATEYITKPLILDELEAVVSEKAKWIEDQKKD